MKYLKYFKNSTAVGSGVEVNLPNVSYLQEANVLFVPGSDDTATVVYNSNTGEIEVAPNYSQMYLTFEALETTAFGYATNNTSKVIYYSTNDGNTWAQLGRPTDTSAPILNAGEKIIVKCDRRNGTFDMNHYINFASIDNFKVYGNVMSVVYGDDFRNQTSLSGMPYACMALFMNCTNLMDVSNLILPAMELSDGCYFNMFGGCTSITTAPELPALNLKQLSYYYMFNGCSSLNYIKAMLLSDPSSEASMWVAGVSPTGTFVKNSAATWDVTGSSGVPTGWTVETADA